MPSLNPIRLRGVAWLVEVEDVRPKPSCDQRTDARPKAIRARLRTACTATCGSSAQAWTHRSPSERFGVELVGREVRQPLQRRRLPGGQPEPVLAAGAEQRRPEPEGDGQPRRRQPDRLAGVVRRGVVRPGGGADLAGPRPRVIRSAATVQSCSSPTSSVAGVGDHVERREVQPVLHRGDDPGLAYAVEGVASGLPGRARPPAVLSCWPRAKPPAAPGRDAGQTGPRRAEQATARDGCAFPRRLGAAAGSVVGVSTRWVMAMAPEPR